MKEKVLQGNCFDPFQCRQTPKWLILDELENNGCMQNVFHSYPYLI